MKRLAFQPIRTSHHTRCTPADWTRDDSQWRGALMNGGGRRATAMAEDEGGGGGDAGRWLGVSLKGALVLAVAVVATHVTVFFFGVYAPYSAYFRLDTRLLAARLAMYRRTAADALVEARAWQSEHGHAHPLFSASGPRQQVCVGVLSRLRQNDAPGVLSQCVAALVSRTPLAYESAVRMTVFNAETPGPAHAEAGAVADVVRVEELYDPADGRPGALRAAGAPVRARHVLDYATVLRRLHAQGCAYGLVLEDDAIAGRKWAERLLGVLAEYGPDAGWVSLRLVASFNWMAWDLGSLRDLGILLGIGCLATALVCVLFAAASKLLSWKRGEDDDGPSAALGGALLLNFVLALVLAGRPNVVRLGRGVHRADTQAGATAALFPRARLYEYALLLEEHLEDAQQAGRLSDVRRADELLGDLRDVLEARSAGLLATGKLGGGSSAVVPAGTGAAVQAVTVGAVGWPWTYGLWTWLAGNCYAFSACGKVSGAGVSPAVKEVCVPSLPTRLLYAIGGALGVAWGFVSGLFRSAPATAALAAESAARWANQRRPRAHAPDDAARRLPVGDAGTYALRAYAGPHAGQTHAPGTLQPWGPATHGATPIMGGLVGFSWSPLSVGGGPTRGAWGSLWRGHWHPLGGGSSRGLAGYRAPAHVFGERGGARFSVALLVPSLFAPSAGIVSPLSGRVLPGAVVAYDFADADEPIVFDAADFMSLRTDDEARALGRRVD